MQILRTQQGAAAKRAGMPLLLVALAGCLPPPGLGVAESGTAQVVDARDTRARDASTDASRRWSSRRGRTLRVWVEPVPRVAGWTATHASALDRATSGWSAGAPIRLQRVSQREVADIVVAWLPHAPGRIRGITQRWVDHGGEIVRAQIWIALQGRGELTVSAPQVIEAIALHELGHALGLGHSDDPTDIMYHDLYARELSPMDRSRLSVLYPAPAERHELLAGPRPRSPHPERAGAAGAAGAHY